MIVLQLSAAHGPGECELAVKYALSRLLQEAEWVQVTVDILETRESKVGYSSVIITLAGQNAEALAERWTGTLQWICASPLRANHRRKNWFIGGQRLDQIASDMLLAEKDIVYQTSKASGAGGQHVNKTESAIRAVHLPSGVSVRVESERSQHANKKRARQLLAARLAEMSAQETARHKAENHRRHSEIERGNPRRVFRGPTFCE